MKKSVIASLVSIMLSGVVIAGDSGQARNAAEVSSDLSLELFRTAWKMLASRQGWDDIVTLERLATFSYEWNSNASFREEAEAALLERLKGNRLMQTDVRDPLGQDELRNRVDAAVNALE